MGKKARGWLSVVKKVFRHNSKSPTANSRESEKWTNEENLQIDCAPEFITNEGIEDNRHVAARLTEHSKEHHAAIAIQSCYRGYLARRALRALKSLVKLQALVRGYNVRKQAQLTMRCMQSLVRVQERMMARRLKLAQEKHQTPGPSQRQRQRWPANPHGEEDRSLQGWTWFDIWRSTQPPPHYARLAFDDKSDIDACTPRTGRVMSPARSTASKNNSSPGYMAPTQSAKAKVRERGYSGNYADGARSPSWRSNHGSNHVKEVVPGL